ncbi:EF-hand domain-containing protein [Caenorhabditis elegans]|uniref:EF-hand domain-containing protein n=1 Tax=Caenorhabditis elegans TaxID=6239 RepID=Q3V5K4_CAEEL|nr:EF-hand domain-containing protein [Caenorhabditis elegans]CCD66874.2 EF-hand domain-containing protein [Caenorhabditis elegans]|eukprot:NP_001256021.2 Uncharacterized protein CELE_Y73C8B.5 [Caenorhabditis elegans]
MIAINSIFFLLIILAWIPNFGSSQDNEALGELTGAMLSLRGLAQSEENFKKVFQEFDEDGNGFISVAELEPLFSNFQARLSAEGIRKTFRYTDIDRNGQVDLDELIDVTRAVNPSL